MRPFSIRVALLSLVAIASTSLGATAQGSDALPHETKSCNTVVETSFRLASDVGECQTTGLVIGADDVTIDLDGHSIFGPEDCCAAGIGIDNTAGHRNLRVRNGKITRFTTGIESRGGDDGRFNDLTLVHNGNGLKLSGTAFRNSITDSLLQSNEFSAVSIAHLVRERPSQNLVGHNSFFANVRSVELIGSDGDVISDNSIVENHGIAVQVADSSDATLKHNSFLRSVDTAVQALRSTGVRVIRNSIKEAANGIVLDDSDDSVLRDNLSGVHNGFGIALVNGSSRNRIEQNRLRANYGSGIALLASSSDNTIVDNDASANQGSGIVIDSPTSGNRVLKNSANDNYSHGIETYSMVEISRNVVKRNGFDAGADDDQGLGIRALDGTPGGGNIAKNNDDPDQCEPASLCA